jgi:hypothetical protein
MTGHTRIVPAPIVCSHGGVTDQGQDGDVVLIPLRWLDTGGRPI